MQAVVGRFDRGMAMPMDPEEERSMQGEQLFVARLYRIDPDSDRWKADPIDDYYEIGGLFMLTGLGGE